MGAGLGGLLGGFVGGVENQNIKAQDYNQQKNWYDYQNTVNEQKSNSAFQDQLKQVAIEHQNKMDEIAAQNKPLVKQLGASAVGKVFWDLPDSVVADYLGIDAKDVAPIKLQQKQDAFLKMKNINSGNIAQMLFDPESFGMTQDEAMHFANIYQQQPEQALKLLKVGKEQKLSDYWDQKMQADIASAKASTNLKNTEADALSKLTPERIKSLQANTEKTIADSYAEKLKNSGQLTSADEVKIKAGIARNVINAMGIAVVSPEMQSNVNSITENVYQSIKDKQEINTDTNNDIQSLGAQGAAQAFQPAPTQQPAEAAPAQQMSTPPPAQGATNLRYKQPSEVFQTPQYTGIANAVAQHFKGDIGGIRQWIQSNPKQFNAQMEIAAKKAGLKPDSVKKYMKNYFMNTPTAEAK